MLEAPPPPRAEVLAVTSSGVVAVEVDLVAAPAGTQWQLWVSPTRAPGQCAAGVRPCVPLAQPVMLANGAQRWNSTYYTSFRPHTMLVGTSFFAVFTVRSPTGLLWASPVTSSVVRDAAADTDHDGLGLDDELWYNANPTLPDTDGGGELDGQEFWNFHQVDWPLDDASVEQLCTNGVDDDSDGRLDGCDDDCAYLGQCREGDCSDGIDGEIDGLIDCEDGDCAEDPACYEVDCFDGADGDRDGVVDCADEDCWNGRCADTVLAWVSTAVARRAWSRDSSGWRGETSWRAANVQGRVRLDYPSGVTRTCTWSVDPVAHAQSYNAFSSVFPTPWPPRTGFAVQGGCAAVDERLLPPLGPGLWGGGWYGAPNVAASRSDRYGTSGFSSAVGGQRGAAVRGRCADGSTPVEVWQDLDGDGYAVDGLDMHGALGGRFFLCGAPGPGWVARTGDCDDGDPTWSPLTVLRQPGRVDCLGVRPDDLDADGAVAGVDRNDRDAYVR